MKKEEYGARQAVSACLGLKSHERIVIITDKESLRVGEVLRRAALEITQKVSFFVMEELGTRPLKMPKAVYDALKNADASIYAARELEDELVPFREVIYSVVSHSRLRHCHMGNVTSQILKEGMCVDYDKVREFTKKVYDAVKNCSRIRIVTKLGTDCTLNLSKRYKWVKSDGHPKPSSWCNLPDGEVFTAPLNANGVIIVDGVLGHIFDMKYGCIRATPLHVRVKDGRAEEIWCKNKLIEEDLRRYIFGTDRNSSRVGEFAFGTNLGIKHIIGNMSQDEKYPSVHIAFGDPYCSETKADWKSKAHVDCVILKPTVFVDEDIIMKEGKYIVDEIRKI